MTDRTIVIVDDGRVMTVTERLCGVLQLLYEAENDLRGGTEQQATEAVREGRKDLETILGEPSDV